MDDLLATWGHSQAWAAAKGQVLVLSPDAAMGVCVEQTLLPGAQVSWSCVCERMRASLALCLMCHAVIWLREISLPPLAIWGGQESWPQGHKSRKASSALHQLQQSGGERCISPGHNSKAGPGDVSVGALDPRM